MPSSGSRRKWTGKRTVEAIQKEVACEIVALLKVVLPSLRKAGNMDLEAVEGATRAAVDRARGLCWRIC